jgi:hypothetical protein
MKAKLTRRSFLLLLLIVLCFQITGCLGFRQDITNNPKYKTDYAKDQIYRTQKPLFLYQRISTDPSEPDSLNLERPGQTSDLPKTIEEYSQSKTPWKNVLGVVESNTKIQIIKLQRELNFENGWEFYVQAKVLDGVFAGKIVEIGLISNFSDKGKNYMLPSVNSEFLELQK